MSKLNNQQIDKLYKLSATEIPPKEIDLAIICNAKEALRKNDFKYYYKWRFPISVAASITLVSTLYILNNSTYQNDIELNSAPQLYKQRSPIMEAPLAKEKQIESSIVQQEKKYSQDIDSPKLELNQKFQPLKTRSTGPLKFDPIIFKKIDELIVQGKKDEARKRLTNLVTQYPDIKVQLEKRYPKLFESR